MRIRAMIGGREVDIQVVRRTNGTVYIRRSADFSNPSPAQQAMRLAFAQAAMDAFSTHEKSRQRVNMSVKARTGGMRLSGRELNEIERLLASYYPGQVARILRVMD